MPTKVGRFAALGFAAAIVDGWIVADRHAGDLAASSPPVDADARAIGPLTGPRRRRTDLTLRVRRRLGVAVRYFVAPAAVQTSFTRFWIL
jgi:hypothetical protein